MLEYIWAICFSFVRELLNARWQLTVTVSFDLFIDVATKSRGS